MEESLLKPPHATHSTDRARGKLDDGLCLLCERTVSVWGVELTVAQGVAQLSKKDEGEREKRTGGTNNKTPRSCPPPRSPTLVASSPSLAMSIPAAAAPAASGPPIAIQSLYIRKLFSCQPQLGREWETPEAKSEDGLGENNSRGRGQ